MLDGLIDNIVKADKSFKCESANNTLNIIKTSYKNIEVQFYFNILYLHKGLKMQFISFCDSI